jgi:hypothetical protein
MVSTLAFKCNLFRYSEAKKAKKLMKLLNSPEVRWFRLSAVDP